MSDSGWGARLRMVADIGRWTVADPRRLAEVAWWIRHRRRTTMGSRTPWWPRPAIEAVGAALPRGARVLEFGGGGSTLWMHDLGARVVCVEHDARWYEQLRAGLPPEVEVELRTPAATGSVVSEKAPGLYFDDYVAALDRQTDGSLDLVVVDGRARVACGLAAREKVRPGGMLLLDDSDRDHYAALRDALADWPRQDFRGLKIGSGGTARTTVWTRP